MFHYMLIYSYRSALASLNLSYNIALLFQLRKEYVKVADYTLYINGYALGVK